jgi:hypothetical protein
MKKNVSACLGNSRNGNVVQQRSDLMPKGPDGHEGEDMSKNEDHLFDELIGALEAMSRDAQTLESKPPVRRQRSLPVFKAPDLRRHSRSVRIRMRRSLRNLRQKTSNGMSRASRTAHGAFAPLADIRLMARMVILFVIAGAVTLLIVTRPFTSGQADARISSSPAAVVAQTHTELERVNLRGVDQPAWSTPETSGIEPPRIEVEEAPSRSASLDTRYVPTQIMRVDPVSPEVVPQPEPAQQPEQTTTPQPADAKETTASPELEALYQRGLAMQKRLDIASARLMFKRAADQGHAGAAFAFAETHDALVAKRSSYGVNMDAALARKYYSLARDLGNDRAEARLEALSASSAQAR